MNKTFLILFTLVTLHCYSQNVVVNGVTLQPGNSYVDSINVLISATQAAQVAQNLADTLASQQRAATIVYLKSKAYSILNGITIGATLTTAEQTAAIWVLMYSIGAVNPATNKTDSTLNYIH